LEDDLTNKTDDTNETQLSSEEIDAISGLISPDPVSAEQEKLERLKATMVLDNEDVETDSPDDETIVVNSGEGQYRMVEAVDGVVDGGNAPSPSISLVEDQGQHGLHRL